MNDDEIDVQETFENLWRFERGKRLVRKLFYWSDKMKALWEQMTKQQQEQSARALWDKQVAE